MAVQMLAFETGDDVLLDEIDALADALENDERFPPSHFAKLLTELGEND